MSDFIRDVLSISRADAVTFIQMGMLLGVGYSVVRLATGIVSLIFSVNRSWISREPSRIKHR